MAFKGTAGRTGRIFAFLLLFGPAFILVFIGTRSCDHKFKELEDFGLANSYKFVDAYDRTFTEHDFSKNVVLINVLQSDCLDTCSVSFWHLNQGIYQDAYKNRRKEGSVRIVSFITDGKGNQEKDLSTIRQMMEEMVENYDKDVWYIASGDVRSLYDFERNGQTLLQKGDQYFGGEAFQELLLLLDKNNHLRMVLSGKTEGMIRRMNQHIALLQKQYDKEAARH